MSTAHAHRPAQAPGSIVTFVTAASEEPASELGKKDALGTFVTPRASLNDALTHHLDESTALAISRRTSGHQDTPDRWAAALQRAQDAGIRVYQLAEGRHAVTSAHDAAKAYEVTIEIKLSRDNLISPMSCTCPAAAYGDPVCNHRAAVRAHLSTDPEPPAPAAYDPVAEQLRWAENDLERAHRDLDRLNDKLARDGRLSDRDYAASLRAQDRAADAWARISELKAQLTAQNGTVAA